MNLKDNFNQLKALLLLRYQLSANQIKKAGKANVVISFIMVAIGLISSVSAFFTGLIGGSFWFQDASINTILITWNVILLAFIFMWAVGLMTELQQTELMSIDKLLHLPLSLRGAFFLNYTSSFINTSFILFVPMMLGLALGMLIARGITMAIALPAIFAFLFFVTSLTYQFRGWLGRIMENKRTRGSVFAFVTIGFVALSQVPHLITTTMNKREDAAEIIQREAMAESRAAGFSGINAMIDHGGVDPKLNGLLVARLENRLAVQQAASDEVSSEKFWTSGMKILRQADAFFPLGWMPLGIVRAAEGSWLFGAGSTLAMILLGILSLTFSYRSTMKKYLGVDSKKRRKKKSAIHEPTLESKYLLRQLPWCSERVSTVAVTSFRSLVRAPESKMLLILPIILFVISATLFIGKQDFVVPKDSRPLLPILGIAITMFSLTGLICNQFGMDRDGFRCFMLSPIERSDIFVGKNIGFSPLAIGFCFVLVVGLQILMPMNFLSFLATLLQVPAVYLLICVLGNTTSIYFPLGIKRSTMQPANPKFIPLLVMMLVTMFGLALMLAPTLIAYGVAVLLNKFLHSPIGLIHLLLSLVQLTAAYLFYRWIIPKQGRWLWKRETKVLDTVANFPE
ncbi:MAG: hypothetical protein AB8B55_07210 [Mariniblastus sp.]